MRLRTLIGGHAGEIQNYSPIAARGALASGVAEVVQERVEVARVAVRTSVAVADRPLSEPHKVTPSRRKGER